MADLRDAAMTGAGVMPRVALVNMPFSSSRTPSIQLGLLQAVLAQEQIEATSYYFNLQLGKRLGWEAYEILGRQTPPLLGDWLFARAAFAEQAPDPWLYLESQRAQLEPFAARIGRGLEYLCRLREHDLPAFVRDCAESVDWGAYQIVGFTSIFAQNTAALALARLLKERYPRLLTVFGGANFEDEMGVEYVRAIPWIDYAVLGEGDVAFPTMIKRIAVGEELIALPGVAQRAGAGVAFGGQAPATAALDQLPDPDYTDYFATAAAVNLPADVLHTPVRLPYESARGCWWGVKQHCTFCGLNGMGMAFRSKSPARVLAGIQTLAERYGVSDFVSVDNIMDMRYVREVFGVLAEQRPPAYTFFHEVKANLTAAQLELLARAGVTGIQPGIESLSTPTLRLMRKGVSAIQNVCLLKWAQYHGIEVLWNLLDGFPGERVADYERQLAVVRLIPHLPPANCGTIELHRFSPNYTEAAALGIENVRPHSAYGQTYPATLDLDRIAYFFEFDAPNTAPRETHEPLYAQVLWWRRVWGRAGGPFLTHRRDGEAITVTDGRQPGEPPLTHRFSGQAALAYEFCGPTHHGSGAVLAHLREHGYAPDRAVVQRDLDHLTALGLMLEEDGSYLSLSLPEREGRPA